MHITVYLGANCGTDPHLAQAVRELGAWIGGGSKNRTHGPAGPKRTGAGGQRHRRGAECFMAQELQYDGLTQLIVTRSMAERKAKMIQLGEPSRFPRRHRHTLEEITEVMSQVSLGQTQPPLHPLRSGRLLSPPEGPSLDHMISTPVSLLRSARASTSPESSV